MSKPEQREVVRGEGDRRGRSNAGPVVGDDGRHLSLRIPASLFTHLEQMAVEHGESISHVARRLLADGVARAANPGTERDRLGDRHTPATACADGQVASSRGALAAPSPQGLLPVQAARHRGRGSRIASRPRPCGTSARFGT